MKDVIDDIDMDLCVMANYIKALDKPVIFSDR